MPKQSYFMIKSNDIHGAYTKFTKEYDGNNKLVNEGFSAGVNLPNAIANYAGAAVRVAPTAFKKTAFNNAVEDIGCELVSSTIAGSTITGTIKVALTNQFFKGACITFNVSFSLN